MTLPTLNKIHQGDSLKVLKSWHDLFVQTVVTSPPYWGLRDYGVEGQIGLEETPEKYVAKMVDVFREVRRVLKNDGTLWLNLGDSYVGGGRGGRDSDGSKQSTNKGSLDLSPTGKVDGYKQKDLVGIPWMVAFALRNDGWYLRSDIIWSKPNSMPESVTDRPTKAHEYLFLLTKSQVYFYDSEAIREPNMDTYNGQRGAITERRKTQSAMSDSTANKETMDLYATSGRNKRSIWTVPTFPYSEAHFATFPEKLIEPCILAGSRSGGGRHRA